MGQFRKLGVIVALSALLAPAASALAEPGPYPIGYDGSSPTPTGYGVVYNVPPAQNVTVKRPREIRVIVRRGGVVSAAY